MNYDVIIIGGGPAGLMCQYQLSNSNLKILLIDKNKSLGKKLLLTGNGRCNVTNNLTPQAFMEVIRGQQKKFFYKALHAFPPTEVVRFFESLGVPLQLENHYQYFPKSNKANDILQVLTQTIDEITVHLEEHVSDIKQIANGYQVSTNKGIYKAKNIVVSTGSKSFPKTGSTGDGVFFAEKLHIKTTPFYPAETKIYSKEIEQLEFQGLQVKDATVKLLQTKIQQKGDLLFTHNGLSGPVIYHLSEDVYHHIKQHKKAVLSIDLLNISYQTFYEMFMEYQAKTMESVFAKHTSKRLASIIFSKYELPKKHIKDLKEETFLRVYDLLSNLHVQIEKVEDEALAYVNGGGVLTKALNPNSMEAKNYKGLYFIGETIDIHGPIGGFNITIAFATAYLCASYLKGENHA
jgi:predicted Rossmann fold flavoprotein